MSTKKYLILILSLLLVMGSAFGQSNTAMYKEAQKIFRSYRYQVDLSDFQIKTYTENGQDVMQLLVIMKSGRNRFDEALMVGFAASGAAIVNTKSNIDRVSVVVKVQYKDEVSIAATADAIDVAKFYSRDIDATELMGRLVWY